MLGTAAAKGALAGAVGVAVMTAGERIEQRVTGRPDSFVPGRTFRALVRQRVPEHVAPAPANWGIHVGQGVLLGALRGMWSEMGMRGPTWNLVHAVMRLALDQTLENATRHGAPPASWPRDELAVDLLHKATYSVVTGRLTDRWVPQTPRPLPGRFSH